MSKPKWGSLGLSLLVVIVLLVWMVSGEVKVARGQPPESEDQQQQELTRVQVQTVSASSYEPGLLLQGQLQPWHAVTLGARVAGTVEDIAVAPGDRVSAGTTLLTLSDDGREAMVARWLARVRKLEADLMASRRLQSRNLSSRTDLLAIESDLAAARAELTAARQIVDHLTPRAPFDGIINRKDVEPGMLVQVGSPLFELVRVDRLKAVGQIPQQSVAEVAPGQRVQVDLLDGTRLEGQVTFIASAADPSTRSFAVEVAVDNPQLLRVAGASASLRISLPEIMAMFISPAYLSLGADGRPGVRYVDDQDRVVFATVSLLSVATSGAWVTGLPDEIRLITRGGGFVAEGEKVIPVEDGEGQEQL